MGRDGPGDSALLGCFSDWRDIIFDFGCKTWGGLSVCGAVLEVNESIKRREWDIFDGVKNASATVVNLVTWEEHPAPGFVREGMGDDRYCPRIRRNDDRGGRKTRRPRELVWQRQRVNEWYLRMDLEQRVYDVWWCRSFVAAFQRCLWDLAIRPGVDLLPRSQMG